jgi:UDP-N-acetylglucosamine 2-epimerase (non-hydrolysing)
LDKYTNHIFVHTGQNFTPELHDQFFGDLDLRLPDYQFNKD